MKKNIKDIVIANFLLIAILLMQMVTFTHHHKIQNYDHKASSSYKKLIIDAKQDQIPCAICELISLGGNFTKVDFDLIKYLFSGFLCFAILATCQSKKSFPLPYISRAPPVLFMIFTPKNS